jgi:hypothetical protein
MTEQQDADDTSEEGDETPQLFCGDLVMVEVSVPTVVTTAPPTTTNNGASSTTPANGGEEPQEEEEARTDFKLLLPQGVQRSNEDNTATIRPTSEMKAARDREQKITKTIRDRINADRAGNGDGSSRFLTYLKMSQALQSDAQASRNANTPAASKLAMKSRRKSKTSLRKFTKGTRKSKKGSDEIKGWSVQGKLYMERMVKKIQSEENDSELTTSVRKKWESMYKMICKMAETGTEGAGNGEEDDGETFEMNEELMYVELLAV